MDPHEAYFRALPREEQQLVALKALLYEGSWAEMRKDLLARREGRPYVVRLESRIDDDLRRIETLEAYERTWEVNLGQYVESLREVTG